jgi:hypothetical protein
MKTTLLFLNLFMVSVASVSFAQGNVTDSVPLLEGIWKLEMEFQKTSMEQVKGQAFTNLDAERKESLYQTLSSRMYLFDSEGNFHAQWVSNGQFMAVEGRYSFDKTGMLVLETQEGQLSYQTEWRGKLLFLNPVAKTQGVTDSIILKKATP